MTRLLVLLLSFSQLTWAGTEDAFQKDIDSAIQEILLTHVGQAICQKILGAHPDAIRFHLGVSSETAQTIAQNCSGEVDARWVSETSAQDIRKLTLKPGLARRYVLLSAETVFPIESWTQPFTNTTVLMAGREGVTHERLVQLLAHELGVYFDSKANPAHPDAQNVPELRGLKVENAGLINPLVAISDPQIAHTMTFVRALQVEYAIVDELIAQHKILPPPDHDDPYLQFLVSAQCRELCLEKLIAQTRTEYLPIALPLLAFAPHFRGLIVPELAKARPLWLQSQGASVQDAIYNYPNEFFDKKFSGNPLEDLQRIYVTSKPSVQSRTVTKFLNDLWYIEEPAIVQTRVNGQPFLEFMKKPLLSGSNILLSSGPRVRVRTGNVE